MSEKDSFLESGKNHTLGIAIKIAAAAHEYQLDKSGQPYILHPLTVMMQMEDIDDRIAAVLHDVVEDTQVSLDGLISAGIPLHVVKTIDTLSRREGETVKEYYKRIKLDDRAIRVKIKDLEHNMSVVRMKRKMEKEDINRLEMYHKKWLELWEM